MEEQKIAKIVRKFSKNQDGKSQDLKTEKEQKVRLKTAGEMDIPFTHSVKTTSSYKLS